MIQTILEFYTLYVDYFAVLFFLILLLSLFRVMRKIKKVLRYFGDKQFEVTSYYAHDPLTRTSQLMLRIYNKNIHDLRLSSFGYQYQNESIDLTSVYKKTYLMSDSQTITVQPRDYLELSFDSKPVFDTILQLNQKSYRVKTIKAYVTDAQGMTTISNVSFVKSYIQKELTLLKKDVLKNKKRIGLEQKAKRVEARKVLRDIFKKKVKSRWNQIKSYMNKSQKVK